MSRGFSTSRPPGGYGTILGRDFDKQFSFLGRKRGASNTLLRRIKTVTLMVLFHMIFFRRLVKRVTWLRLSAGVIPKSARYYH